MLLQNLSPRGSSFGAVLDGEAKLELLGLGSERRTGSPGLWKDDLQNKPLAAAGVKRLHCSFLLAIFPWNTDLSYFLGTPTCAVAEPVPRLSLCPGWPCARDSCFSRDSLDGAKLCSMFNPPHHG
ncbi:hypothetical protein L1987_32377 [Smallanthus sonchifolius]|uniref:Uncharacterized protein n=1 Tax=Smallanthus sonchifolius TaxID=185202 RepID=A0ACB9HPE4_9ASTR|nr:hypothetical protein L1987_32377 [Smallanthus sonchifolius]